MILLIGAAAVAGCDSGGEPAANESANAAAAATPQPKRAAYCFFKDAFTKGWSASAGAGGDVTVKGRVFVDDARYKGSLGPAEIVGAEARVPLGMAPNDTGFASPDDWWDLKAAIPGSGGVATVVVLCGEKVVATLKVPGRA